MKSDDKNGILLNAPKLVEFHKAEGDFKSALRYSEQMNTTVSEMCWEGLQDKRISAQEQYEALEKEQRIKALEFESKVAASNFRNMLTMLLAGFLLVLGTVFFWLNRQKQKQKQNYLLSKKEIETQEVRQKLLTSITHELRKNASQYGT